MPRGTLSTDQFRYQLQDELTISKRFSVSQGADLQLGVERVRILSAGRTAIGGTTELRFASSSAIEGKQFVLSGDPVKVVSGTGRAVPAAEAGEAAALSAVFRELPSKLPVGSVEVGVVEKALAQPLALHVASMLQPFTGVLPRVEATAAAVDEVKLGDGVAVVVLSFEARMTWPKAKLPWEATVKGTAELRADDGLVVSTFTRGDISATDEENRGWEGGRFDVGTKCVHEWGDGADGSEKVTGSSSR